MLTIVKTKNGGHVISWSEKRAKHIVLVYNAHPSCKIKKGIYVKYSTLYIGNCGNLNVCFLSTCNYKVKQCFFFFNIFCNCLQIPVITCHIRVFDLIVDLEGKT